MWAFFPGPPSCSPFFLLSSSAYPPLVDQGIWGSFYIIRFPAGYLSSYLIGYLAGYQIPIRPCLELNWSLSGLYKIISDISYKILFFGGGVGGWRPLLGKNSKKGEKALNCIFCVINFQNVRLCSPGKNISKGGEMIEIHNLYPCIRIFSLKYCKKSI